MQLDKKGIFISTGSQIIVRVVGFAVALISIKLLANYLGAFGVGEYNTVTTYINFFIVVADLGLFSVALREISKDPGRERKIIGNVFIIRLLSALVASAIALVIVFSTQYSNNIKFGVLVGVFFLFFNLMASIYDIILQYRLKMQFSAIAEFLSKILSLVALYFVIRAHGNFLWIVATLSLSGLILFITKWAFSRKFVKIGYDFDRRTASWIFGLSWPLGLVFIVNNLFFKLDTMILFVIKGASAVGIYSVSYKILEVTGFIGAYFASSLKPTLSSNIQTQKKYVSEIIRKSILVMLFFSTIISIICIVFSKELILFISNKDFLSGAPALILLSLTLPLIYVDILLGEILIANDSRKLLIRVSIFILLFNFATNLIFIPLYSFMGAAFTTLLSEAVLLGINLYYVKKIISLNLDYGKLFSIFLVSVATLIFGFLIKSTGLHFIILVFMTMIIYVIFAYALKLINIKMIKELISSR